jgi:hypothetical protein
MKRAAWALVFAIGCAAAQADLDRTPRASHATLSALLPEDRALAPSQLRITARDASVSLSDVDTCATCHSDVADQWKTSAHFFASFDNPIYRASVVRFRESRGNAKSRFCGGCHDPALTADGMLDGDVPSGDLRAFSGVTCRTCHGAEHARKDGNGSLDLRIAPIELPKDGDAESIARHKISATPAPLRTSGLCIACHRVFLDEESGNAHHLAGQDDGTPWMRSAYAGSFAERVDENVPASDCRGCHMPKEDAKLGDAAAKNGKISSHRFLGAHSWLASMRGDSAQVERVRKLLANAVTIDVVAARIGDGAPVMLPSTASLAPGDRVVATVAIKNVGVGHRFPGGTLDAQDTWVEMRAEDAHGKILAVAGDTHERAEPTFTPGSHVLRAVLVDAAGKPVLARETEAFRATVVNHTIAPRDAEIVEYAFDVPKNLPRSALPIRFVAKLRHRSRSLTVQDATCAFTKTAASRAFDEGFEQNYAGQARLDACKMQPIVDIGESSAELGAGAGARDASRDFDRAYAWAEGAMHVLGERLDEARAPLAIADRAARNDTEHAMAESLLGAIDAKQNRVTDALAHVAEAEKRIGAHPFFDRVRGEALASTWRTAEAIPFLCAAASRAPHDDALVSELAVVLGSARDDDAPFALEASRAALVLQPRDESALRVQSLALASLNEDAALASLARAAWLARRTDDDASAIKARCSANVSGCADERDPVRLHPMRPDLRAR